MAITRCSIFLQGLHWTRTMSHQPPTTARLKNLGPKSARWLNAVGLYTLNDLKALGSIETYYILKERGFPVSLNLVYAIEGAILGHHWNKLSPEVRDELKVAVRLRNLEQSPAAPPSIFR